MIHNKNLLLNCHTPRRVRNSNLHGRDRWPLVLTRVVLLHQLRWPDQVSAHTWSTNSIEEPAAWKKTREVPRVPWRGHSVPRVCPVVAAPSWFSCVWLIIVTAERVMILVCYSDVQKHAKRGDPLPVQTSERSDPLWVVLESRYRSNRWPFIVLCVITKGKSFPDGENITVTTQQVCRSGLRKHTGKWS